MTGWDPGQYERFADERLRPALDLIARIPGNPSVIWDLGCGTGVITGLLADRWPNASVYGLDSSPEMLERARRIGGIEWVEGTIESWGPAEPADLVFSNAALQWVGDHDAVLPRLAARLRQGGTLAIQMPRNYGEPSHLLLAETARSDKWRQLLGEVTRAPPVAPPDDYLRILRGHANLIDIWETTYLQVLQGEDPVAEWARATGARPYLDAARDESDAFIADYTERLRVAYPPEPDGTTLFPFRRLFIVATR